MEKISQKLTMGERFVLLNNLPREGDLVTFKILRKLRETLSPDEREIQEYEFKNGYRCPNKEYDGNGKAFRCEVEETSIDPPKCPIHDLLMQSTGTVSWSPDKWDTVKEVWFGAKANQIIIDSLKKVSEEDKKINDDILVGLYEKFVDSGEEE